MKFFKLAQPGRIAAAALLLSVALVMTMTAAATDRLTGEASIEFRRPPAPPTGQFVFVTFHANGGNAITGANPRQAALGQSLGSNMPTSPTRANHSFAGWNTAANGTGSSFNSATVVNTSMAVYAQWTRNGGGNPGPNPGPDPGPLPGPGSNPGEPGSGLGPDGGGATLTPTTTDPAPALEPPTPPPESPDLLEVPERVEGVDLIEVPNQEVPLISIGNTQIPLFAWPGNGSWGLVNLILAGAGLILAALKANRAVSEKRREKTQDQDQPLFAGEERRRKWRLRFLTAAMALSAAGVLLFIITQDVRAHMVLVNVWTIAQAAIFAIELIIFAFLHKDEKSAPKREAAV